MRKAVEEPLKVVRQPLPELEVGLARDAVAPGRGNFDDLAAGGTALDHKLDAKLKTAS